MFYYSKWMELSLNTRNIIASALGIIKKGGIEVVSNRVVRDGYDFKDVEHSLSVINLQTYLNTDESDFNLLWEMMVNKAEGRAPILPTPNLDTTQTSLPVLPMVHMPAANPLPVVNLTPEEVKVPIKTARKFGRVKGTRKINGVWVKPPPPVM